MIGRLVRAIRPGDDSRPPGREARRTHRSDDRDGGHLHADHGSRGRSGEADQADQTDVDDVLEEVFLDPDEQILLLLSQCDGRMWQQGVVERTDYSAARVSELLSEMEAEGRVNRYWRDGEKVVSFAELDPE